MARIDYWQYLLDRQGRPLQNAQVRVYLAGSLIEANIYLDHSFGSVTISSTEDLKTDIYGFIQFWIGDEFEVEGGYNVEQQFRVVWENTEDSITEEIDNLYVFTPVRQLDTSNSIKGQASNKDFDKVISNKQGHKWDNHVGLLVPSASPHDLEPVTWFDLNEKQSKVISNKLGYQMYEMAETASVIPIDISAARYYSQEFAGLSLSGGLYYGDIVHSYNNYYPIVRVMKASNDHHIEAKRVESINPNTTRIWLTEDIAIKVAVFG